MDDCEVALLRLHDAARLVEASQRLRQARRAGERIAPAAGALAVALDELRGALSEAAPIVTGILERRP